MHNHWHTSLELLNCNHDAKLGKMQDTDSIRITRRRFALWFVRLLACGTRRTLPAFSGFEQILIIFAIPGRWLANPDAIVRSPA
jgi:hypothetical protein